MTAALDQAANQAYQQLLARQAPPANGQAPVVEYSTLVEGVAVVPGMDPDLAEIDYHRYNADMENGLTEAEFKDLYLNKAFEAGLEQVTTAYSAHREAQDKVDQVHQDLALIQADMQGKMTEADWAAFEAQYKLDHGYDALVAEVDAKAAELAAVLGPNQDVFLTAFGNPAVPLAGPGYDMIMAAYQVVGGSPDPTVALEFGAAMLDPANHTPAWQPSAQEVFDDVLGPAIAGLITERTAALAVDGEAATPEELDGIFQEVEGWMSGIGDRLGQGNALPEQLKDFDAIRQQVHQLRKAVTTPTLGGAEGAIAAAGGLSKLDLLGGTFSALGVTMLGLRLGQDGLSPDTAQRMADAALATEDLLTVSAAVLKAAGRFSGTAARAGSFLSARLPIISLVVGATQAVTDWKNGNQLAAVGAALTAAGVLLGPQVMLLGIGVSLAAMLFAGDDLDARVEAARESYATTLKARFQAPPTSMSEEEAEEAARDITNADPDDVAFLQELGMTTEQMHALVAGGVPIFDGTSTLIFHDMMTAGFMRPDGTVDTEAATAFLLALPVSEELKPVVAFSVMATLQQLALYPMVPTDLPPGSVEWRKLQIAAYLAANPNLAEQDPDGYRALQMLT